MEAQSIATADRDELIAYLEQWGFMVYDDESTEALREAAMENFTTEGR